MILYLHKLLKNLKPQHTNQILNLDFCSGAFAPSSPFCMAAAQTQNNPSLLLSLKPLSVNVLEVLPFTFSASLFLFAEG